MKMGKERKTTFFDTADQSGRTSFFCIQQVEAGPLFVEKRPRVKIIRKFFQYVRTR